MPRRRRAAAVAGLCLLAAARARADGPAVIPFTYSPAFTASPTAAGTFTSTPAALNVLQPHRGDAPTDLLSRLNGNGKTPLAIPLSVQFGQGQGVSFLYSLAAAPSAPGQKIAPPPAASYGFRNALAFSHDALHLTGMMQFGGGKGADGKTAQSQVISQALAFDQGGWKFDAHYSAVGKDNTEGSLKASALKLGMADDQASAAAGQLAGLVGQKDLGLGLAHTDAHGTLGFALKENTNELSHVKTTEQTLSFGRTFGHGMQFEATHNAVSAKPTQGDALRALTTTTNHLKLGLDGGKGMSFSAEANTVGDSKGRAEQHMAYAFANQFKDAHFSTHFGSNSVKGSDGKATDQTLGMDFDRQGHGLGLRGSFLQFSARGKDGASVAKTTEHLELAAKDTQIAFNLQSSGGRRKDGSTGDSDKTLNFDLARQTKGLGLKASVVQFAATGADGAGVSRTTEHLELALKDTQVAFNLQSNRSRRKDGSDGDGDKTLTLDMARQTRGLSLKANVVQFASTGANGQAKTSEALEMSWQAHRNLSLQGHWHQAVGEAVHPAEGGGGAAREEQRDLTATLTDLRLARGLRNSQVVLNLCQAVSQGKAQKDTRALVFKSDMPDTHVHLEYTGSDLGWDKQRNTQVSRAIRVASISPGDWLQYSAYYKQRSQSLGGRLPDIRDYTTRVRLRHVTLAYHYMNQHEEDNGSVSDVVRSTYEADGALTKKLAWNVRYEQSTNRLDTSGLESWLVGIKGELGPRVSIEAMLGRPELRVDGTTVPGQSFKLTFLCKLDETDAVALNGEVTNWSRKTRETPGTVTGNFRLDINKGW